MFVDEVCLTLKAGKGGNGCISFRREKYVPRGGPYGGDGGKGGDIVFVASSGLTTLVNFRHKKIITAPNGENGMSKNMFGKNAEDVEIEVPLGTVVYDANTNAVIADIVKDKERVVICCGGKGGRGNTSFASARIPAPQYAEGGEKGEEKDVRIELKILADVGLVGFPGVGKSTLISVSSNSKPKIADYPFTTLIPNLGVVQLPDERSFVMADIPGLIKGASAGLGLGIRFLKHIERTRVILHLLDMSPLSGRDPVEDYNVINAELAAYDLTLAKKPQIVVANKMDIGGAKENLERFKKHYPDLTVVPISAYTKDNVMYLLYKTADLLAQIMPPEVEEASDKLVEYKFKKKDPLFLITKTGSVFNVTGAIIEKYLATTDFNKDISVKIFAKKLRDLGVEKELRRRGVKEGDTVLICGYEFELFD